MDELKLLQYKLVQLLHDPPGKAFFLRPGMGGHRQVAKQLFEAIAGVPLQFVNPAPDLASAGADRPVVSPPSRTKGASTIKVDWVTHPVITHPLASGKLGCNVIDLGAALRPRSREGTKGLVAATERTTLEAILQRRAESDGESEFEDLPDEEVARREQESLAPLTKLAVWTDANTLRQACIQLWRLAPDCGPDAAVDEVFWEHQPADSREPDHSLWDHLRVASALAFMQKSKKLVPELAPWLFAFSIGPVQSFIEESRTSCDLWTSSLLLSDLMWHAMLPIVERYGPETIIYPDLRGNPRADQWLVEREKHTDGAGRVLSDQDNPCSYAGMLPNTFVALLPRGEVGSPVLLPLQELAEEAKQRLRKRWLELAELAKRHFLSDARKCGPSDGSPPKRMDERQRKHLNQVWERQHKEVLSMCWSAVEWSALENVKDPVALAIRNALPAQRAAKALNREDQEALTRWLGRHTPWIPVDALAAYADARYVYAKTNLQIHQCARGFDYALIHHALHSRHAIRKAEAHAGLLTEECGEKCTLCGKREALGSDGDGTGTVDAQRKLSREFWRSYGEHGDGSERLCAVCTMKRLLISAGQAIDNGKPQPSGLTSTWAGARTPIAEVVDRDNRLRVPFPSTATVAAQEYLCGVVREPELREQVHKVVQQCRDARLRRSTFARAMRSLAEAASDADELGREFLEYEAEYTAYPEAISEAAAKRELGVSTEGRNALRTAVRDLRSAVTRHNEAVGASGGSVIRAPNSQVALIAVDGDSIRKLLLGTSVGACWRDVIHPKVVEQMGKNQWTVDAGWPHLLDRRRLMGPSTHAFANRVLASFAHVIVPWVVEREFSGRLIYAGGDDVLALARASEALDICARLQQVYSAAWVVDTNSSESPWSWRQRSASFSQNVDPMDRFVVVAPASDGQTTPWPIPQSQRWCSVKNWTDEPRLTTASSDTERLLPMMGAGQTLSAGIAIGHYKTPLGELLHAAWEERDRAKNKHVPDAGRHGNAFSIRRYSRSGEKSSLRMGWDLGDELQTSLSGYFAVRKAVSAFADRRLSGRLPYKLRELETAVIAASQVEPKRSDRSTQPGSSDLVERSRLRKFAKELFSDAGGDGNDDHVRGRAFEIWWQGLEQVLTDVKEENAREPRGHGSEGGLALCRFLGAIEHGNGGTEEAK